MSLEKTLGDYGIYEVDSDGEEIVSLRWGDLYTKWDMPNNFISQQREEIYA